VAIVCQKLIPSIRPDTPRIVITEVLLHDAVGRKMIMDGQEIRLADIISGGNVKGSHDFTISLKDRVMNDWITRRVALEHAPRPDALRMALKGISIKSSTLE
ncbi:MAG: twitching motility protein PilT, partial [Phycisphaerae bacterium]|jgi:twitching motility protein PilT|nr:twitching motility protein PilT [Phycisphaerae bacterium]